MPSLLLRRAILGQLELDPKIRELVILQVAKETEARYEWVQHIPIAQAIGVTDEQIALVDRGVLEAEVFDRKERLALAVAREVLREPCLSDATFEQVRLHFSPREILEVLLTVGYYQMLARLMTILEIDIDDDKYFERLRAEVYFTEMHQFEGFFALLLAVFQKLPHWLYLTLYETREIKQAIKQYLAGDVSTATSGAVSTVEDFITYAVYAGFSPEERHGNSQWEESVDNIDWFIKRVGERYLKAEEYNAYKHGLRVLTGHSRFTMQPNDPITGILQGTHRILWDSEDSLSILDFEDKGEGGQTVVEVVFDNRKVTGC